MPLLLVVSFMVRAALAAPRVLAGFDLIDNALVPRVLRNQAPFVYPP